MEKESHRKLSESQEGQAAAGDQHAKLKIDPFEVRIQEEVEEFLRDLTLEYPFPEIFETLRRCEFKDRFGSKVIPFPKTNKVRSESQLRDIELRIEDFLEQLNADFGPSYQAFIQESFRFYTQTTVD